METFLKLFFISAVPFAVVIGWLVQKKYGFLPGVGMGIFVLVVEALLLKCAASLTNQSKAKSPKTTKVHNIAFAKWATLAIGLTVMAIVPFAFLYTPLGYGLSRAELPFHVGLLELIFVFVFVRGFFLLKRVEASGDFEGELRRSFQIRVIPFFLFTAFGVLIGVSIADYNSKLAMVISLGGVVAYFIYYDFYGYRRSQ